MNIQIIHFYPDLMSLYGSYANVAVLRRTLEQMGNTVTVTAVQPGEEADIASADFLFMGAGTERAQKFALADFRRFGEAVKAAAEDGCPMLFAGTAMELLGKSITDEDGTLYEGIGLGGFAAVQGSRRFVEDVYGHTDLYSEAVVGFANKCSTITGVEMLRQRGRKDPRRLPLQKCVGQPSHRPSAGKESPDAGCGHCRHLCPPGRRDAPHPPGQLGGAGLGHYGRTAEAPQRKIKKNGFPIGNPFFCFQSLLVGI